MTTNDSKPVLSLKNFTEKIIDYAGLFPPASLELPQAFHNYVFYSQGEYRWMLGKFIIPAKKLSALSKLLDDMAISAIVPLSILGTIEGTVNDFTASFSKDLELIKEFMGKHGEKFSVEAFEVRLPQELYEKEENDEMLDLMINITSGLEKTIGKNIPVFYETRLEEDYEAVIIRTVETIASLDKACGFKLRTGGTEASAFPAPEQIAFAIMTCCEFNVPMKCTAGLHHPIRHFNEEVNTKMHGFMNVFAAGILAYTENLDETELVEVLTDEDPYEFEFTETGLVYGEMEVPNPDIKNARQNFMLSYGSCSFDEPIEDLKTLELF
jgi:hypothetical protein